MAKLSKKQKQLAEKVESGKAYSVEEAVALISEFASKKFSESLDVCVNLGIDARKSDQAVRGSTILPNGTGKEALEGICLTCHNATQITRSSGYTQQEWQNKSETSPESPKCMGASKTT